MTEAQPDIYAMHFLYHGVPTVLEINHEGGCRIGRSVSMVLDNYPPDLIPVSVVLSEAEAAAHGELLNPGEQAFRVVSGIPVNEEMDLFVAKLLLCMHHRDAVVKLYEGFASKRKQFEKMH